MSATAESEVRLTSPDNFTPRKITKKPTLQYAVLTFLLLWALAAQLTYSGFVIYTQVNSTKYLRVPFTTGEYSTRISGLRPGYENSGLKIDDEVLALNSEPLRGVKQLDEIRFNLHPGDRLVITVRRTTNGQSQTMDVPIVMRPYKAGAFGWATAICVSVLLPLSCLIVGFYIAFARPRDPLAWITMTMLASFGQLGSGGSWAIWSPWREMLSVYHVILANSWPLWMVLFALYFPVPFGFIRKHPWLNWVIAVPSIFFGAFDLYGTLREGMHLYELQWLAGFLKAAYRPASLLFTGYVFAFFFLLAAKRRVLKAADARRRLNIMRAGCSVALLPLLLLVLSQLGFVPQLPVWLTTICLVLLLFFPITMAYVIVVQRAMDVRMVIRTGIRYALASTGVKILRLVLIASVAALTLHFALRSSHHVQAFLIAAVGAALIFALGRVAKRVSGWMDRRFFREAYNTEVILADLSNSVAGIRDTKALLDTVTRRIADSLHVLRIAVLLERGDQYEPACALGYNGTTPQVELKQDAATIRLLKQAHSPSKVYFDDPQSWVHGTSGKEQAALMALDSQVLLPLAPNNRMLGVISLGPKRSETPYSKADLQLLGAVASQTGLALENARLTESIRQEVAERERINRELEIARDVQQRLFPQTLPKVQGLDFAGYCRPVFGVGGDYYDFIKLSDGCIGIAIGDVSGKGIAAALMMASLQASLRGQTIRPCSTLSEMIAHINRLVYDASADNRYATFFYAQYDPQSHALHYVNAGHNPPIVCRKRVDGKEILRLTEGGLVVGLFPAAPYQEAQLTLQAGDVVVAFTDGISEAMNKAEQEWDEERLIETIRSCNSRSAADMINSILERVDAFTVGTQQHDDMTLVVMRVQ